MKKLYRKGAVHPSPPLISDYLAFLPATILTLAAALSPEDREVLAYLVSCSSCNFSGNRRNTQKATATPNGGDHPPTFNCSCFRCYTSYWVRWDSSPNRQLIHEIIDAFEEGLARGKKDKNKRERRKRGSKGVGELTRSEVGLSKEEFNESDSVEEIAGGVDGGGGEDCGGSSGGGGGCGGDEEGIEKGSVRKFVSFIGERFWGVWN